ncbi:MAG: lytic transglycosylase domain-containing protein, partial [Actinomycetota bacterium]|nr:lytic transglycosylase domain-containing protein [Actinomycetota bacterium]
DAAVPEQATDQMAEDLGNYRQALYDQWVEALIEFNGPYEKLREESTSHVHTSPRVVAISPGVEQWRPLVATYFLPEDVDNTLIVMDCESGGLATAANPNSSARGLMQIMRGWYSGNWSAAIPAFDPFDPELNIKYAAVIFYANTPAWRDWVCKP